MRRRIHRGGRKAAAAALVLATAGFVPASGAVAETGGTRTAPPSVAAGLQARADRVQLAREPEWLALGHYERRRVGAGWYSPASTPAFFLSESGADDPRAELHATLQALAEPLAADAEPDAHVACRFPARKLWLERRLSPAPEVLPSPACPAFREWRESLRARGVTLIFPEGYMNNPASVFGHTLLRVDSTLQSGPEDIRGWAVDFTAETGDDGGLFYMARGMSGRYPGRFGVRPYYEQLKRYSDWENRDIWEYRLALSDEQLDLLLAHLWELAEVEFPYYFFTKNCSYALLRLLEVSVADLRASERFPVATLPVESVRLVAEQPGLVTETRYRPSPETQLRTAFRTLPRDDRRLVRALANGRLAPDDPELLALPETRRARVLEVAYDLLRYRFLAGAVSDADSRALSRTLLVARSRLPRAAPGEREEVETPGLRPDEGHRPRVAAFGAGWRDDDAYLDFQLRPAFHELLDDAGGHLAEMQVRVLDTVLRVFPESGQVRLQELTLLEAGSLHSRSHEFSPWAWSTATGLRTRRVDDGEDLDDAAVWGSEVAAGAAWELHRATLFYALGESRLDVGPDLDGDASVGPGARIGLFLGEPTARMRAHLHFRATRFVLGDTTTSLGGGLDFRITTSRQTAIHLRFGAHRIHGEGWVDAAARFALHF